MSPLAVAARSAFYEYCSDKAEPDEGEVWDHVVRAVLREVLAANTREGERPVRAACLIAAAVFASIKEWRLSEALTGGQLQLQEGEPFFILRGQDRLAPEAIRHWINAATIANVPEHKIEHAEMVIAEIERWPGDKKYPD